MTRYVLTEADGSVTVWQLVGHSIDELVALETSKGRDIVAVDAVADEQVPADRTFRAAWRRCSKHGLRTCMDTARNIQRDRMREKRKMLFAEVDAAYMRALMQGKGAEEVAATAQKLRDVTKAPEIDQIETPEALAEFWPDVLGEPLPRMFTQPPVTMAPVTPIKPQDPRRPAVPPHLGGPVPRPQPVEPPRPVQEEVEYIAELPEPYEPPHEPEPLPIPAVTEARRRLAPEMSLRDVMAAVERAERADTPLELPEPPQPVQPPPVPPSSDEIAISAKERLKQAVHAAQETLTADQVRYDMACRAVNGNHQALLAFGKQSQRANLSAKDYADTVIEDWRACERAWMGVIDAENDALDAMEQDPGDSENIVDDALLKIKEGVESATAYRG